jgi:hypothetical protein
MAFRNMKGSGSNFVRQEVRIRIRMMRIQTLRECSLLVFLNHKNIYKYFWIVLKLLLYLSNPMENSLFRIVYTLSLGAAGLGSSTLKDLSVSAVPSPCKKGLFEVTVL